MSLEERFEVAAEKLKSFTKRPTDQELLDVYALYKQSLYGDNGFGRPNMYDIKGKKKWQAWIDLRGMANEDAKKAYIEKVEQLSIEYL